MSTKFLSSAGALALAAGSMLSVLQGCGETPGANWSPPAGEEVGAVSADLDVGGVNINSASYSITGPNGFSKSGSIDLSSAAALSATIGGLPAGTGYSITLTATSTNGLDSCAGSATFAVVARTTAAVAVHLTCHETPQKGSALVTGTLNVCPIVDSAGASPNRAIVGTGIRLTASAHDSDSGPAALGYAWTATSGVFDNPAAQNPLFTCSAPGTVTITVTVADGDPAPTCPDNLSLTVDCDNPAPHPYAWVVMGSGGAASARVVTPEATCPTITIDGVDHPMNLRAPAATIPARTSSATPVKPSAFPVTACEYPIPTGSASASVLGASLPLPKAVPQKIVIIGDTGCRLKTGNPWQACSDTTQWPFQRIADAAAAQHPDLVLHVGDYHYRENACPANITGCQGSPWSYGFDTWEADLFRPAASLMQAAPWIMVRGNHEECLRGGQGWFRFLDTRPFAENHSCNDPANDTIANYNDPYAVPLGTDTQVIVFDTAKAGATALNPASPTDGPIYNIFKAQLQQAATLASNPNIFSIFANHHPLLAYTPAAMGNPTGGILSMLSVMQGTYGSAYYPPNIGLAFHGHVHLFEAISYSTPHPPTFVSGMGGDNLDAVLPDPFPFSVVPAAGVTPDMIAHDSTFGFMTMERLAGSWIYKAYRVDGSLMTTCSMMPNDKLTCTNQGFLH